MKGANVFSKIDLRSRYNHIKVKDEDFHMSTFRIRYDYNDFMVLAFGLTNAPSTFMCIMNNIFSKYLKKIL